MNNEQLVKVEGHDGLRRDTQTGAVVNTDRDALLAARARKQKILNDQRRVEDLEAQVKQLTELVGRLVEQNSDKGGE